MKNLFNLKRDVIIAGLLVAIFFILHSYVYKEMPIFGDTLGEVPIIQSYTDAPVDITKIILCEEKRPTYFNPFRKVEFSYQINLDDTYGECTIIERAESMFTSKMKPVVGDPYDYWGGFEEEGFGRPQVGYTYANLLFFIVQYFIIGLFFYIVVKPTYKKKKK